ncbi:MAG: hypothetical protein ACK5V9_15900, partial [Burkholderiales bacterium]
MSLKKSSRITAVPAAQMDWLSDLPAQGLSAAQTVQWLNLWTGQGLLRHIDSAFAAQVLRLDAEAPAALLVAAAMLAHMEGRGHTCLSLAELCQPPVALLGWPASAVEGGQGEGLEVGGHGLVGGEEVVGVKGLQVEQAAADVPGGVPAVAMG